MESHSDPTKHRLLIIDDNPTIHEDIKKILCPQQSETDIAQLAADLFGTEVEKVEQSRFKIDSAYQGQEGLAMVEKAITEGDPYTLAFVDVRMPPGWDGVETIRRIWEKYPELQVVICTAYSDHSWEDIIRQLGQTDSLVILKKPFDNVEVLQLAHALTKKWALTRESRIRMDDLDEKVRLRTAALSQANEHLQAEVRQRMAIEIALRASEERFQKAFRAASFPMAILKRETMVFLEVNDSFATLVGRERDDIMGKTPMDLGLLADPKEYDGALKKLQDGQRVRDHSCRIRRKNDEVRQVLVSLEPVVMGEEDCLLLALHDVTEQIQLEARLRYSQKMEAIGQLAAGVAHDFNNLLTIIHGHTSLQMSRADLDQQVAYSLKQVKMAADRAAELTKQLLTFSRKQVMKRKPLNLAEVIERVRPILARMVGETIALEYDVSPDLPTVLADEHGVEQIVMNLVVNARDATPAGGRIRIAAQAVTVDTAALKRNPEARNGQFVCLTVEDNGCGIETTFMNRLFEPFFTTKSKGEGMGLGLSTVYGIAKQHEGWVEVASKKGIGSSFRVHLPLSDKPVGHSDDPVAPRQNLPVGKIAGTVLVVEDEMPVRELISSALQQHGYSVLQAGDGVEAMFVWQASGKPVDLLLTDIVMPNGVGGMELATWLSKKSQKTKVLYTSGYNTETIENADRLHEGINFLPKPFSVPKLIDAVQRCLGSGCD
jgi:PAS domain S-box-containing protein